MPAYDYKCNSCGHRFEERQSFYDDPVANCPICDSQASRQFVAVPIVFKGSGFYVNDYGKGSSYTNTTSRNGSSENSGSEDSSSGSTSKASSASSSSEE
ncbi:MAG: zinc ribbon domain-containing protein [Chloroflexota bacterium]|nr:zinc ribbon domain-containing protein [Chloroflexota bacterium]MCY3638467.1 zinc ribbon domain-containing protein [Chloroflexota bacterium]MDE2687843.1 zinc ribbon domain-containing protein [Chloroflexota bacterium]MYC07594.1 zinc ribbon domain-containing protein [Chloroflexota bacterium]